MIWLRTAGVITEKEEKGLSIQSISDSQMLKTHRSHFNETDPNTWGFRTSA